MNQQIDDALNKIVKLTDQSRNLKKELKREIHETVSSLRNLIFTLKENLNERTSEKSQLQNEVEGRHFGTVENIEKAVTDQLKAIPVSDYQHCYEDWEQRLQRCVASQGNYFEGDKLDLYFKSNYRVIFNQSHYFIKDLVYMTYLTQN